MRRRRKHCAWRKVPHNLTGAPALDSVQLAIINKRLEGVCRKMANTLFRTWRSGVLNTARERRISIEAAEHVYGVVLSADGSADITASEALRNKMSVVVF